MGAINARQVLEKVMAESLGLSEYEYIMKTICQTDVSKNMDFQRRFNHFYKVRRNQDWRKKYYEIFERNKAKKEEVTFENILCNIYVFTDRTEASFASKLLATLNPDKPIWDSRVLNFLGLKPTGKSASDRQDSIIEVYGKIENWYKKYLITTEAKENIRIFDEMLPCYSWISDVKKIDYIIWGLDAYKIPFENIGR